MLIGSLISFGILFLAWLVLPVREAGEASAAAATSEQIAPSRQSA
jgi:hypothetical protein